MLVVAVSPSTTMPRMTATTGFTYAYVDTSEIGALPSSQTYEVNPTSEPTRIR